MLLDLLGDIHQQKKGYSIQLLIVDDHSASDYDPVIRFLSKKFPEKASFYRTDEHHGKVNYWKVTNFAYNLVKKHKFNYVFQLPDDVRLVSNFFRRAIKIFDSIDDPHKICLNILNDHSRYGRAVWTPVKPTLLKSGLNNVWKTGWVDMCYISTFKYFESLNHEIYPVNREWSSGKNNSSGVGMQISNRFYSQGLSMYQVANSLVIHGTHQSVMHPQHRKHTPLVTNHNSMNKITASLASIPGRVKSLQETINSIINQVDEIHVYLNEWKEFPAYLQDPKIKVYKSQDEIGDIGDVGKFYTCEKIRGYHFTIDDDLVYPPDYVSKMIQAIEAHNRKVVVSCHGRIFGNLPVKSYYHGHTEAFSCLRLVPIDKFIHVCGTGVLAYHTDTLKLPLAAFETSNMADIWFSKVCQEKEIPVMVQHHMAGWIKTARNHDENRTIYANCHNKDQFQTQVANSIQWKVHHP